MAETLLFWVFFAGVVVAGAQVILRRNPVHAAMSLVACFFFLAGVYLLLSAHLIAILQVMVYAGAVMVLFVFVIMLLNLREEELGRERVTVWKGIGALAVAASVGLIVVFALRTAYSARCATSPSSSCRRASAPSRPWGAPCTCSACCRSR